MFINCISFSSSSFPVLSSVQVYMAWCPPPPPTAPVYFVDDGLLHWPVTRLRSQTPPNWCPGRLCAGSSGGLFYSECSHHTTYIHHWGSHRHIKLRIKFDCFYFLRSSILWHQWTEEIRIPLMDNRLLQVKLQFRNVCVYYCESIFPTFCVISSQQLPDEFHIL